MEKQGADQSPSEPVKTVSLKSLAMLFHRMAASFKAQDQAESVAVLAKRPAHVWKLGKLLTKLHGLSWSGTLFQSQVKRYQPGIKRFNKRMVKAHNQSLLSDRLTRCASSPAAKLKRYAIKTWGNII